MYVHASKRTVPSAVCPGVTFTVRQISYGRRQDIARRLSAAGADNAPAGELSAAVQLLRALMSAMLLDVSGLEIDGKAFAAGLQGPDKDAAIDELLDAAPEPLVEEIFAALLAEFRLGEDAEKNSAPPSGSSLAGTEGGSIAPSASASDCGRGATAAASTPSR